MAYPLPDKPGGINVLDLQDGSNYEILSGKPPFPAFHAWGEWLYYAQTVDGKKMLRRCNYLTLDVDRDAVHLTAKTPDGTVLDETTFTSPKVFPVAEGQG